MCLNDRRGDNRVVPGSLSGLVLRLRLGRCPRRPASVWKWNLTRIFTLRGDQANRVWRNSRSSRRQFFGDAAVAHQIGYLDAHFLATGPEVSTACLVAHVVVGAAFLAPDELLELIGRRTKEDRVLLPTCQRCLRRCTSLTEKARGSRHVSGLRVPPPR